MLEGLHRIVLPRLDPEPGLTTAQRQEVERTRDNMRSFAEEGAAFRAGLIDVLHDEASVRDIDHPRMVAWIKAAGELNSAAIRQPC